VWTAAALWILTLGGAGAYVAWAVWLAAHGVAPWLLILGAPVAYLVVVFAFMASYFAVAWFWRSRRPRDVQIGIAATLRLVGNEYRALAGSARRMMLYRWLVRDPAPAKAALPVLLLHGVLCNAGVWLRMSRALRASGVAPVYTMSYGPPLASIETFADQVAAKVEAILAITGAPSLVIVSHSMGGLVALAYCRKYGAGKVRLAISLGTPYHGSVHAYLFPGACLAQLRPGNTWLDALLQAPFTRPWIVSIWSWHDSMVAPQTSSRLEGAEDIALVGVGHNALLADPGAFSHVVATLRAARADTATSESPESVARTPFARA